MSDIGTPMTGTIPAVGTTGTTYATQINAFLEEVKERLEARVPLTSLLIGSLDLSNNELTGLSYIGLYENTSSAGSVGSLENINGDIYWVGSAGAVQITDGASINSAGIGGITGDYGGVNPAQLRFDDSTSLYSFYDDFSGGVWAYSKQLGVDIAGGSTSLVRVRILWDGASSYTLNLPDSLPAAQAILQVDNTGAMTATNTLASNQNLTLQGTGKIVHGSRTIGFFPEVLDNHAGSFTQASTGVGDNIYTYWSTTNGTLATLNIPALDSNAAITTVSIYTSDNGSNPGLTLGIRDGTTLTSQTAPAVTGAATTSGGHRKWTITVTTPSAAYVAPSYYLNFSNLTGGVLQVYRLSLTYTTPA